MSDNNPMLRDGVTGDWYVTRSIMFCMVLTMLGSAHSLVTKALAGLQRFRQMRH